MRFGMPYLLECGGPEDCAALCRDLGLDFLQLNLSFPDCTLPRLSPERLLRLQRDYGIGLTMHMDELLNPCAYDPDIRRAYADLTCRAITLAKEAGIPLLNLHWEPGVYVTLPDRVVYMNDMYRQDYLDAARSFRDACAQAAGDQVILSVENTDGWRPFQLEAISMLLEAPCFGLTLDIGHDHCAGGVDLPWFRDHMDRLRHMHAHDGDRKPHKAFGDGQIDIRDRLRMAHDADTSVVLQVKTIEALRRTVALLPDYLPQGVTRP